MKDLGRALNKIVTDTLKKHNKADGVWEDCFAGGINYTKGNATPIAYPTKAEYLAAALAFRRLQRRNMKHSYDKKSVADMLSWDNNFGENFIKALDDSK